MHNVSVCISDPEGVGTISVAVVEDKLTISWEATLEPNDFYWNWNYTVTVSDNVTGREVFSDVLNDTELSNLSAQELNFGWYKTSLSLIPSLPHLLFFYS